MDNTPIYKYIPLKYIISMYVDKRLYLSNIVADWVENGVDKYELYIRKGSFEIGNTTVSQGNIHEFIFSQSWTLKKESEAMWNYYSRDMFSIKVRTTKGKLLSAIQKSIGSKPISVRIEDVKYVEDILESQCKIFRKASNATSSSNLIKSICIKRSEFDFEKESRLIICCDPQKIPNIVKNNRGIYISDIDFDEVFEKFCIDPRLDKVGANCVKFILGHLTEKCSIVQSNLHSEPQKINLNLEGKENLDSVFIKKLEHIPDEYFTFKFD